MYFRGRCEVNDMVCMTNMLIQIILSLPAVRNTIIFDMHVNESQVHKHAHTCPAALIHTETWTLNAQARFNYSTWFCFHVLIYHSSNQNDKHNHNASLLFTNFFLFCKEQCSTTGVWSWTWRLVDTDQTHSSVVLLWSFWIICQIHSGTFIKDCMSEQLLITKSRFSGGVQYIQYISFCCLWRQKCCSLIVA